MPNMGDGANVALPKGPDGKPQEPRNKCRWSNCQGHEKDIDKDYPSSRGNVERRGQQIRDNLFAREKEPWNGGGYGETNIREMYLDQRKDGVITIKSKSHPYRIQAHHLIPVEVMDKTSTLKENAVLAGWDINHVSNGMFLPEDAADVALHLLQQHHGSHPGKYMASVEVLLKDLQKKYKKTCQNQEGVSLQQGLANDLALTSNTISGKIISIRQHAAGVDFWQVHTNSLQVYQRAVRLWNERRERHIEQQRARLGINAKPGDEN